MTLPTRRILEGGTLAASEAEGAMNAILEGQASDVEIAALLTALAARANAGRSETEDELVGFALALTGRMRPVRAPHDAMDTCGTGGSGAAKLNVSTLVALTLAALGCPVAKHGNRSSVAFGSSDVLELAGLPLTSDARNAATHAETLLASSGLAFLHAPHHHPALGAIAPIRRALGFRTVLNLLGPLASPARVARQLVGVSDARRVAPIAGALARLGRARALVFGGAIDELVLEAPRRAVEVHDGAIAGELLLDPREHGVRVEVRGEVRPGLDGFLDVLDARSPRAIELVAWNAGVALAIARTAPELLGAIGPGVREARAAIEGGLVRACFDRHRALACGLASRAASAVEAA